VWIADPQVRNGAAFSWTDIFDAPEVAQSQILK
jgi:hypothetical protein